MRSVTTVTEKSAVIVEGGQRLAKELIDAQFDQKVVAFIPFNYQTWTNQC